MNERDEDTETSLRIMISSPCRRTRDNRQPPINQERARWITIDGYCSVGAEIGGQRLGRRAIERQSIE
jgi:hypothetical protein